jgi:hypothetical protein
MVESIVTRLHERVLLWTCTGIWILVLLVLKDLPSGGGSGSDGGGGGGSGGGGGGGSGFSSSYSSSLLDVVTADTEEEDQLWNTIWLRGAGDGAGGGRRHRPRGPW